MHQLASSVRLPPGIDVEARARRLLEVGFDLLGIEGPFYSSQVEPLLSLLGPRRLASVRLFLPYPTTLKAGAACPWAMGETGSEARRDAARHGSDTIVFADRHEIPYVLVPQARLELSADRAAAAGGGAVRGLQEQRDLRAGPVFSSYRGTLEKLLAVADRYNVRLALTPSGRIDRAPSPVEVDECLREFRGAPLCVWPETRWELLGRDVWRPPVAEPSEAEPSEAKRSEAKRSEAGETSAAQRPGVTVRPLHENAPFGDDELDFFKTSLGVFSLWLLDLAENATVEDSRAAFELLEGLARGSGASPFVY